MTRVLIKVVEVVFLVIMVIMSILFAHQGNVEMVAMNTIGAACFGVLLGLRLSKL